MRWMAKFLVVVIALACAAHAGELKVAAANNMAFVIKDLAANFEKATGNKISVTLGSSGNFFAQIQNGAPFDVFLSADMDYPKKLEDAKLAELGTLYKYATGRI